MVRDEADAFALPYCRRSAPFKNLNKELFAETTYYLDLRCGVGRMPLTYHTAGALRLLKI